MLLKEVTATVEKNANCKVAWELGKKYKAFDLNTGKLVAEYNPETGELKMK